MNILSLRFKFGQTYSIILVGTVKGFMMFNIHNEGLEKTISNDMKNEKTQGSGIGLYDSLDNTNIAILVGGGELPVAAPNRFLIIDTHKKRTDNNKGGLKKTIGIKDKIVNAFIVREIDGEQEKTQIIIVTKKEVHLHTINGELVATKATCENTKGLCCVVCSSSPVVPLTIAYPGPNIGEIVIWRPAQDNCLVIKAHDTEITNIALSFDGKQIVTTSKNATNVHVYNTSNLNSNSSDHLLHQFRRNTNVMKMIGETSLLGGLQNNSQILNVCISDNKEYVACCSSNGTIHIFDTKSTDDSQNKKSSFSFLKTVSNFFDSKWAMHTISIGIQGNMICGFDKNNNLHIAAYNGDYFFLAERENFKLKCYSLNTM